MVCTLFLFRPDSRLRPAGEANPADVSLMTQRQHKGFAQITGRHFDEHRSANGSAGGGKSAENSVSHTASC